MPLAETISKTDCEAPDSLAPEHLDWLKQFASAVRSRSFEEGRELCDQGISAFGTVVFRADRLDELEARQWQVIWNTTRDFDFDYASADAHSNSSMAVLLTTWRSVGINHDGNDFQRRGRATIVLRLQGNTWRAIHTHFSTDPTP